MKPIRLYSALLCLLATTTYAETQEVWKLFCPTASKQCQSLWTQTPIPGTDGNVQVAYNVQYNHQNQPIVNFIVNLNRVKLHPEIDMIIVYTGKDNVLVIPIAAHDTTGITAEFTNAVTVNKLLDHMLKAETLSVSFMEDGSVENTIIAIPLNEFKEKLNSVPHGEATLMQKIE